jgi:hypothetical protein
LGLTFRTSFLISSGREREVSRSYLEVKLIKFRQPDFCEGSISLVAT